MNQTLSDYYGHAVNVRSTVVAQAAGLTPIPVIGLSIAGSGPAYLDRRALDVLIETLETARDAAEENAADYAG